MTTNEADRVLVVEDDPDYRFILERALMKNKYTVRCVVNGIEALEILDEFRPKVVIADWTMPQMDGLQLCNTIKQQEAYKSIYFILLTARSSLKDRVTGLDFGADDFLVKPVENEELLARIRSGVRIFNLQTEIKQIEHAKAIVELACTIGHQINNPLSSLKLTLRSIETDTKNVTQGREEAFTLINESIERIQKFVKALQHIDSPEFVNYTDELKMLKIE